MQMAHQACINQFVQAPDHSANLRAGSSQPPNFSGYLVADPPLFDGNAVKNLLGNSTLAGQFLALFLWCHLLSPVGTGVPPPPKPAHAKIVGTGRFPLAKAGSFETPPPLGRVGAFGPPRPSTIPIVRPGTLQAALTLALALGIVAVMAQATQV